jgi:hypothetical protein
MWTLRAKPVSVLFFFGLRVVDPLIHQLPLCYLIDYLRALVVRIFTNITNRFTENRLLDCHRCLSVLVGRRVRVDVRCRLIATVANSF